MYINISNVKLILEDKGVKRIAIMNSDTNGIIKLE